MSATRSDRLLASRFVLFTRATHASAVFAIVRWLDGWIAACPSHAGIVSNQQNLS